MVNRWKLSLKLIPHFLSCFGLFSVCWGGLSDDTLFLTWQRDPTRTMTVQWLGGGETDAAVLHFRKTEQEEWKELPSSQISFQGACRYRLHRVELTQLEPETSYRLKLQGSDLVFSFRTLPEKLSVPLRFVVGGDMLCGHPDAMIQTGKSAASQDPSFALIGGDIAYSVAGTSFRQHEDPERWVAWLKAWHLAMVTSDRRLIPILAAIGNHETVGQFGQTPDQAQWFMRLFPHTRKTSYRLVDIGTYLSIWLLDSGHAQAVAGAQAAWLQTTLKSKPSNMHKLAVYHVPAYPSIRNFHNTRSSAVRRFWVPLFEKYGLQTAFEHHDHAYKRSRLLLANREHPQGILYLGDGAWGVTPRKPSAVQKPFYLEKVISKRHFILGVLEGETQHYTAIDEEGTILDQTSRVLR